MARRTVPAALGWLAAAGFLLAGVPPFLRMPLWCDATLHDTAARVILAGGVHYRDVFETNPPGFAWLLCGVRTVFGPSTEAVRAVDLGVVVAVVAGLLAWARRAGASHAGVAWAAAAAAALYPLSHEFNHAQRDVWMMLPAVAACGLRLRRVGAPAPACAVGEGLLWGFGCWVKPHLLFVAAGVWLATARRLGFRDTAAVFAGGALAGLAGLGWLVGTGAWPHFADTWRNWNSAYGAVVWRELPFRATIQLGYFPPYSLFALVAVPLAAKNLRDRDDPDPARFRRAVLAAAYLAWLLSTLLLQRGFHYAHVPETLLMLAVFAANRWPLPCLAVLTQVAAGVVTLLAPQPDRPSSWVYRHLVDPNPAFDPDRARWWAGCWGRDPPREVRRGVARWGQHFGAHDPVELGAAADFLRGEGVRDGELIAWHDSPSALYAELGVRPGFRFLHVGTAWGLGPWQREQILKELREAAPRARFVVSDLYRVVRPGSDLSAGPDGLPVCLPGWQRGEFPFDQPVVFRSPSGRHLVHAVRNPVRGCVIPEALDQREPNR
ncbi:MAG: hypothetical protein C0501_23590 [Isosphaera sp.]|nr:hypothetical protein [Isosphaera sp.]